MNTEIKNMWRKKSWSIPDLLGSKSEYTKIVIGLIQQIASGNANELESLEIITEVCVYQKQANGYIEICHFIILQV